MSQRGRQDISTKIGAGGWDGRFTVEKPVLKQGYVLASKFNQNEAQKLANVGHENDSGRAAAAAPATAAPPVAAKEITHTISRPSSSTNVAPPSNSPQVRVDQLDSNGSDFHARASHTTVLPTQWDSTFAPGGSAPMRVRPLAQHTNTNNFYGYTTEPEVLPARWDGKFAPGGGGAAYRPKPSPYTNANNFYGYTTEPEVLPAQWDGKFAPAGPGNVYTVPERNQSLASDLYGFNNETVVLPTVWSGKFELDPSDVRVRPERNGSDVRDYADHRNYREVKN